MNAWKKVIITCLSLVALGVAPAGAAPPRVTVKAATPSSAYQGDTLDVVVTGSGFDPSAKVQYFVSGTTNPGGITVKAVKVANSGELTTTLVVSSDADLANFDIVVTLDSGRKGKGTTLFKVMAKPNNGPGSPSTRTYPEGRYWHKFASNGETTTGASRLYMIGGQKDGTVVLEGLWAYTQAGPTGAGWTLVPPGTTSPGSVFHNGWSCGGGHCVLVNGYAGLSFSKDTWVFREATQTWSKVNCVDRKRRGGVFCPAERRLPVMAYDPVRRVHVLFGGEDQPGNSLNDMYLFDPVAVTWTPVQDSAMPSGRFAAVAAFVPGAGIFMHGGWAWTDGDWTRNDAYLWDGTNWAPVTSVMANDPQAVAPFLAMHSMAWDESRGSLIVTSGVKTSGHSPNGTTWYVELTRPNGQWLATWTPALVGCQSAAGSSDAVVHPEAQMAFDAAEGVQVFFGGISEQGCCQTYDNTVECR